MDKASSRAGGGPVLNVLQVIALDIILTVGLLVALIFSGASWLFAFVGAWVGGCVLTIVAAFVIYKISLMAEQRAAAFEDGGSAMPRATVADAIEVWETDRLLELDLAAQAGSGDAPYVVNSPVGETSGEDAQASDRLDQTERQRANGT